MNYFQHLEFKNDVLRGLGRKRESREREAAFLAIAGSYRSGIRT